MVRARASACGRPPNRLTATFLPVIMGGIVEVAGLEASFLIIGAVLVALMALLAVHVKRTPALSN